MSVDPRISANDIAGALHAPVAGDLTLPHLRVSLFGNCNFRCSYCPPWGENSYEVGTNLTFDDLKIVLASLAGHGFSTLKLTGGEPTLRHNMLDVVKVASALFPEVRLITNGWNLWRIAEKLQNAGLDVVELSLDARDEDIFDAITHSTGILPRIMEGLDACVSLGFRVQINTVVMRSNIEQVPRMLDLVETKGNLVLKLLELVYYEYPGYAFWQENFVGMDEVLPIVAARSRKAEWTAAPGAFGTPMRTFSLPNGATVIVKDGAAGAVYADMCKGCPFFPCQDGLYGMTVTTDGWLKACKHRPDLHIRLRSNPDDPDGARAAIEEALALAVARYRSAYFQRHGWSRESPEGHREVQMVPPTPETVRWYQPKRWKQGSGVPAWIAETREPQGSEGTYDVAATRGRAPSPSLARNDPED